MKERVNLEYLNLYQEIPIFCALALRNLFRKKESQEVRGVLIVNTCLIGEFAASLPAIRDYMQRNKSVAVDLMVSPPLNSLAERVRGVRSVYTAKSLYGRRIEDVETSSQRLPSYETVIVMRASKDALQSVSMIAAGEIRTSLLLYGRYALHLLVSVLRRRAPKQWREMNFEMLGGKIRDISFEEIFEFTQSDYDSIAHLDELQTSQKKIVIHTGSSWPMKKWNNDNWVAFLREAHDIGNARFIFVGGSDDLSDYACIASRLDFPVYSLIGRIDLMQLMLVLRASDYFIGIDSGPRNMAHLADVRSISILGPGPHFYMPPNGKDIVIDKSNGRGLFQMFFARRKGFIHQITPVEVYEALKKLWNS